MKFKLLGRKLSHSISPQIHKFFGGYDYETVELEKDGLDSFFKERDFDALNVTVPYKKEVIRFCDVLSENAKKFGNVNLIIHKKDGSLFGDNTDGYGFSKLLDYFSVDVSGKKVLILGSGGSSKTVSEEVREKGSSVTVISRSGQNNYGNLSIHSDAQIIINTTPVGMFPSCPERLISLDLFPKLEYAVDLIYNPLKTSFLADAEKRDVPYVNGLYMLCAQAVRSYEIFSGESITDSVIADTYRYCIKLLSNIVIIGMPGSGKTVFAEKLAERLKLDFIDTDAIIEERALKSCEEIIISDGEAAFRELESEVIKEVTAMHSKVISVGGGAVLNEKNRESIRQNGFVIFVDTPLNLLDRKNRPLSKDIEKIYSERIPIYRSLCDITVSRDNVEEAAEEFERTIQK